VKCKIPKYVILAITNNPRIPEEGRSDLFYVNFPKFGAIYSPLTLCTGLLFTMKMTAVNSSDTPVNLYREYMM